CNTNERRERRFEPMLPFLLVAQPFVPGQRCLGVRDAQDGNRLLHAHIMPMPATSALSPSPIRSVSLGLAAHRVTEVERSGALDHDGVLEHDVAADELAE